ncbi:MAG: glycoside hydrolase family protein, partial [Planctomycetota bacterium]
MADSAWWCAVAGMLTGGLAAAAPGDVVTIGDQAFHRYEWRASTFSKSAQAEASIAVDPCGNLFSAWSSRRQQGGRYGVYGQRFSRHGVAIGGETCLNLWTDSHQRTPAVAVGPKGRTWVVWQSHAQDGSAGAIVGRRFDADGSGGSEILINQQGAGHQSDPVVAVSPDGSALIAWSTKCPGKVTGVRARLLSPDAEPVTDEIRLGPAGGTARTPAVTAGTDGGFVVVYAVADERNHPATIGVQTIDADGRLGEITELSSHVAARPIEPVVGTAPGGYVAAWLETSADAGGHVVRACRLDRRGCPRGEPFAVDASGPLSAVGVTVARDGRFAIAFNGPDGDDLGVFAQLFTPDATHLGEPVRVTRQTTGRQAMRPAAGTQRIGFGLDGSLVCVWDGDGGFGDGSSVNVTLISPSGLDHANRGVSGDMRAAQPPGMGPNGPQPHQPPTFDPRAIEDGRREVVAGLRDIGFTGIFATGWTPPDPHLAVGPGHVVVMTNGAIAFFAKDGTLLFQDAIEGTHGFWGSVGASTFIFDPEVLYDELSGRFFAMAAEAFAPGDRSYVLVAVSDDSNPVGAWHKYRFETTALAGDVFD